MSMKKLGIATVKANGTAHQSYPGAQLDLGGTTRNTRVGHVVHGYSEGTKQGSLKFDIDLGEGDSLETWRQMSDATVAFECDTGQTYVGNHWWVTETVELTDGPDSKVSIVMEGPPMEEMA